MGGAAVSCQPDVASRRRTWPIRRKTLGATGTASAARSAGATYREMDLERLVAGQFGAAFALLTWRRRAAVPSRDAARLRSRLRANDTWISRRHLRPEQTFELDQPQEAHQVPSLPFASRREFDAETTPKSLRLPAQRLACRCPQHAQQRDPAGH